MVSGPPGQGKTRLVREFVDTVALEARVLCARCRPAGETGARNLLRELLDSAANEGDLELLEADVAARFAGPEERRRVLAALTHSAGIRATPELASLGPAERSGLSIVPCTGSSAAAYWAPSNSPTSEVCSACSRTCTWACMTILT